MQSLTPILPCVFFSENLGVQPSCSVNKMSWRSSTQRERGKNNNQRQMLQSSFLSEHTVQLWKTTNEQHRSRRLLFFIGQTRRNQMSWWAPRCCTNKWGSQRHQKRHTATDAASSILTFCCGVWWGASGGNAAQSLYLACAQKQQAPTNEANQA